ncbi:hypothetical protein SYNTR_0646 [Candidatus Syntrophocurvum alkaliphilum]|uniref:Uncharacterized protein n=1 Tax=Candidatus Syntrophocurvum alkaliphilum TaxID=2293317 RepID=A0A6I6DI59_9FIRM|nr:hypothetical protein [Candidatus Syntrophocurvum alkaliphilum]QGT99239.1 hypothetical protein SYNTR_0646 [Candidatus Syntrophocurvum alkaliphilum]
MQKVILVVVLSFFLILSGCNLDAQKLIQADEEEQQLIKVMIHFTDGITKEGYVRGLEVEDDGKVYIGGSSVNYIYDIDGNITGAFNYHRVLYIEIIE